MGWQTNNGKVAKEYADYAKKQADLLAEKQDGLDEIIEVGEFVKGNRVNIEKAITDSTEAKGKSTEAKTTADSVKAQFDRVVAEAGSNNPEVVQARGNEVNLNARFEKVTTQLADTVKKNDVLSMANMGQDIKTAMTGGSVAVVGTNAILADNIVNKQVTVEKISYYNITRKNYANPDEIIQGFLINHNNGTTYAHNSYAVSGFIPVTEGEQIFSKRPLSFALFNSNKTYVSGKEGNSYSLPIVIPNGVSYIRMTFLKADTLHVVSSGSLKAVPYNDIDVSISDNNIVRALKNAVTTDVKKSIPSIMSKLVLSDSTKRIKLIGDSITAGVGGTGYSPNGETIVSTYKVNLNGHCWANSLKSYLESKFNCTVKNYGVSGVNSGWILSNIGTLVKPDDDIIICMVGTNNRNNQNADAQKQFYNDIVAINNFIKGLGKEIIFMSSIPASISNETDVSSPKKFHMEDVDNTIMKATSDVDSEYISLYKLFIEYCKTREITIDSLLKDGLHPNDTGYDVMLYLICKELGIAMKREGATW